MLNSKELTITEKKNRYVAPKGRKRMIKKITMYVLVIFVILGAIISLFITINPVFGENPSNEQKEIYSEFDNYADGKFFYPSAAKTNSTTSNSSPISETSDLVDKETNPTSQILVSEIDWNKINSKEDSLTWFGHSAFLLSMDNKKILIDPMLGPIASPVSFAGPKRYSKDMLDMIEKMPPIDAVFITHDHYDHLDYESIQKLKSKVSHFFVPYGVSNHLIRWGVAQEKITELNWWDETEFQSLTIAFTPSKHFSGRGLLNQDMTLWGSWIILGKQTRFFTSGDGGYDVHFKKIGEKYGPFDIALIEGGQYDKRWAWAHMFPEESVQANVDVKGKHMMLMHWGAFTLANHGWRDPIQRALKEAKKRNVNLIAPQIGETLLLDGGLTVPVSSWWDK